MKGKKKFQFKTYFPRLKELIRENPSENELNLRFDSRKWQFGPFKPKFPNRTFNPKFKQDLTDKN